MQAELQAGAGAGAASHAASPAAGPIPSSRREDDEVVPAARAESAAGSEPSDGVDEDFTIVSHANMYDDL